MFIVGVLEREKRKNRVEVIFKDVINEKIILFKKDIDLRSIMNIKQDRNFKNLYLYILQKNF